MSERNYTRVTDYVSDGELELHEYSCELLDIEYTDYVYEKAPLEEQQEITRANDKFDETVLMPRLIDLVRNSPCPCFMHHRRLTQRFTKLAAFIKGTSAVRKFDGKLTQRDFDNYSWGVIVHSERGINQEILTIMRHCSSCGRIETFGGTCSTPAAKDPLMQRMITERAKVYLRELEAESKKDDYVLKDMVTGDISSADSLMKLLYGAESYTEMEDNQDGKENNSVPETGDAQGN